jgi:hypothetical protein
MENKGWLDIEIDEIIKENKKENKNINIRDEMKLFLMIVFCAFSFFMMNSSHITAIESPPYFCKNDGVTWRCQGCGNHVWSNSSDWKGDYKCNGCGKVK